MDPTEINLLMAYNRWANEKILAAARQIHPDQLRAPAACSFGSLLGTLVHILAAEIAWRTRLQEGLSPAFLMTEADFDSFASLEALWQEEAAQMQRFVEALSPEDLNRWVEYTTTSGMPQGNTLWRVLAHVVNHGTAFRAEAGLLLAGLGYSPGDLDLILFLRQTDQR